ncbi:hypothetical protein AGOR_G00051600 [Albula goreensis]|uniref:Uncharacterized protein n=1 Tax=Albula goreensis TaxID=1534307 RepID=A0A8T3DUJ7_9TELE|nr:hypothetical protein AGOR_G00051600 [Albula goreensis]
MNTEREKTTLPSEDRNVQLKTSDVYRVDQNLPKRFNNPDCFHGYSKKTIHPFYRTTNQTYGGRKPTVHEMPTAFHGDSRRFTEHLLKSGMYRDTRLNTFVDTGRIMMPSATIESQDRVRYHQLQSRSKSSQAQWAVSEQK